MSFLKEYSGKKLNGWIPDHPDIRDFKFSSIAKAVKIPNSIDLRSKCSPVEDQGQIGSCVGNSSVGALEYLINKNKASFVDLSRLFVYYNARMYEGTTKYDCGCYIRDAVKMLANYGVCNETDWPYIVSKFATKPSVTAYTKALPNKITSYYRINNFDELISCLAERFPVIFGFTVYDYFMSDEMAKKGILKLPVSGEKMMGGHSNLAVGFNLKTKRILVRNSWGSNWGLKGYFWMPFDYVSNPNLACDFWTIRN